ncbi:hypothetical protein [Vibrio ostreae]|nr:hypothetical protein [Vibrio ostreae]
MPIILIVTGIYIGMQYKDTLIDWLGQDSLDNIEDLATEMVSQSGDAIVDKLKEMKE